MASDDDKSVDSSDILAPDGAPPTLLPPPELASVAAAAAEVNDSANSAEYYYINGGCCLKVLVAMSHGLRGDDGNPTLSLEVDPWKTFPVKQIRPSKDDYIKEVIRRWNQRNGGIGSAAKVGPRPRAWNLPKIQEWLEENPIVNAIDIAFLKDTVASRKEGAEAARKEDAEDNARLGAGNWNSEACMRLIHALVDHDDLKAKFLNRLNLPAGRSSVENREQLRATNVWQLLAEKWNDKNFSPETVAIPALHTDFTFSDVILHADVATMTPATAEKVEDKWSSMILEMNRCIANWQKSGQGEGGIDDANNEEDQEFGSLENRSQHALACRQSFFRDRQIYLLYLWEMLNRHDLLGSSLQKLNNTVSLANGSCGVPSVVCHSARANSIDDDLLSDNKTSPTSTTGNSAIATLGKSIEKHGQSLVDVAKMQEKEKDKERVHQDRAQLLSHLRKLKGEKRSLLIQHVEEIEKGRKAVADTIMDQVDDVVMDIDQINEQLESLEQTPKKRNRNTPDSGED